ncbi:MAG TPA: O-antigen ligase family protein [Candidatus Acidoferrum sp.]
MNSDAELNMNQVQKVRLEPRMSFFIMLFAAAWVVQRFVPGLYLEYGVIALVCLFPVIYALSAVISGEVEYLVLAWVLLFPLSFPLSKISAAFSLDWMIVGVVVLGMVFSRGNTSISTPVTLRQSAAAWTVFIFAVTLSFLQLKDVPRLSAIVVEAFILPPLLGWYVIRHLRVRSHLVALHLLVSVLALCLAGLGLLQLAAGEDIFHLGAGIYMAGSGTSLLFRPNGPFSTDHSFGLIGLISFCFLLFLWRTLPQKPPKWHRAIHVVGVAAAAITALLPMFRSIAISLLLIAAWDIYSRRKRAALLWLIGFAACAVALLVAANNVFPEVIQERVLSLENVYARVAQQQQTFEVFLGHPFVGVGYGNFSAATGQLTNSSQSYNGIYALDSPHNNLAEVLVETGLFGFVPYFLSQILLLRAFWKMRKKDSTDARFVWKMFLYVFVSYWITGLSLSSGYYVDLNMWFIFVVCCIYKYGLTEDSSPTFA